MIYCPSCGKNIFFKNLREKPQDPPSCPYCHANLRIDASRMFIILVISIALMAFYVVLFVWDDFFITITIAFIVLCIVILLSSGFIKVTLVDGEHEK
jgi:hypothetical protein